MFVELLEKADQNTTICSLMGLESDVFDLRGRLCGGGGGALLLGLLYILFTTLPNKNTHVIGLFIEELDCNCFMGAICFVLGIHYKYMKAYTTMELLEVKCDAIDSRGYEALSDMKCTVMTWRSGRVELGVLGTSALSRT